MNNPLVSIIIPTFNKADLAIATLNSVIAQSYVNWECLVVDDGSNNENYTLLDSFIKQHQKIILHKRPNDKAKGANACRNYGMSISKGDYIQFFDSDDLMLENCIINRIQFLENSNYDFVVFSMGILQGESYVKDTENTLVHHWEDALHAFIGPKRLPWNLQRTLYKKDLIKGKIKLNENLKRFQDIEFNIRLLSQFKPTFKIVETVDCIYRKASNKNPRHQQFNEDVYKSIPVFLETIKSEVPSNILNTNQRYLQVWLFDIVGLYTSKNVDSSLLKKAIKSAKKSMSLSLRQQISIKLLFFIKKRQIKIKGTLWLLKQLKKAY